MAFKIIGRCRSDDISHNIFLLFCDFIQTLPIENHKKELIAGPHMIDRIYIVKCGAVLLYLRMLIIFRAIINIFFVTQLCNLTVVTYI